MKFCLMRRRGLLIILFFFVLGHTDYGWAVPQAEKINLSTEYVSPFGDYQEMMVRDTMTVGESTTATAIATIHGNVSVVKGVFQVDDTFNVDSKTLANYANTVGQNYWFGINIAVLQNGLPRAEFEVNGDIFAGMFRASPSLADSSVDQDTLLYFGPTDDANADGVASGTFDDFAVRMGAYSGQNSADVTNYPGGWNDPRSVCRINGSPHIVINCIGSDPAFSNDVEFSSGNVGIATTNPQYKLQIGNPSGAGSGLYAVGHRWAGWSSREYKKDITPFTTKDINGIFLKISDLNVVRYRYKGAKELDRLRMGVLAEEAPQEIVTADGKGVDSMSVIGFLVAGIRALNEQNIALEKQIAELEIRVNGGSALGKI